MGEDKTVTHPLHFIDLQFIDVILNIKMRIEIS